MARSSAPALSYMPSGAGLPNHRPLAWMTQPAAAALLIAAVVFNAAFAWVNAHLFALTPSIISAAQGAIVLSALAIGALQPPALIIRWFAMTWLLLITVLLTSALRAQFEPKILGDILLIPAFILLGTRMDDRTLRHSVIGLQMLIVLFGLWELARPDQFGAFFHVVDYYVNTRGYDANAFWAGGDLFLSSERPGGRLLLGGLGLHRGSSLFLEPVSLGNWAVVVTLFTAAMWRSLSIGARAFMIASTLILLIVCDGRLALSVILLFCLWLPLCRKIPDRLSIAYLPLLLVALSSGGALGLLDQTGDNFAGRLTVGIQALGSMDLHQLLGISAERSRFDDAGWADFVQAQSLLVSVGLWLFLGLTSFGSGPQDRMAKHGIMLFITLCMPISNSLLSIKTAALMWVIYGFCYARSRTSGEKGSIA